jgi:hypothetical protein
MKTILLTLLLAATPCLADWGGLLVGDLKTRRADYDNCEMNVDLRIDRRVHTFEIAHIDYSCSLNNNKYFFRSFDSIATTIAANGDLVYNNKVIGKMTDTQLEFTLKNSTEARFRFFTPVGVGYIDAEVHDVDSGETLSGRLW